MHQKTVDIVTGLLRNGIGVEMCVKDGEHKYILSAPRELCSCKALEDIKQRLKEAEDRMREAEEINVEVLRYKENERHSKENFFEHVADFSEANTETTARP